MSLRRCCRYLRDIPPSEEPAAPKKPKGPKIAPQAAVAAFRTLVMSAITLAQRIQRRDKELAALSNSMVTYLTFPFFSMCDP